ncbi:MAG TPA: UDP-N-acetylmuramoyl-L-alanyl-D-glutamate--2,6-diaminopimelate ligase [Acidimicrobiales bacterium]|nr:UDP-N-acetylmuramoyl-L-alanyl-D-glutamate--2,6-diaminopimelate ligase [Acidimicrobiales bacterium]
MHLQDLLAVSGIGQDAQVYLSGTSAPARSSRLELKDIEVKDIVLSSGQVTAGALFACIPGFLADGHSFAGEAARRGAVALLCERRLPLPVPQVVVPSVRRALGPLSAAFFGNPSRSMTVVGVTGTNGKTTTCSLLASIFEARGWPAAALGTLTGTRTTPEAPELQRTLAGLRASGTRAVAMEISSHALHQHRVDGSHFTAGVFTNLSQDHLDYHVTMEAYFEAKASLFRSELIDVAVVNRGDPWGLRLVERLEGSGVPVVTFEASDATEIVSGALSASFTWRKERLQVNMPGRFNVTNAVAAATTAKELGVGWDAISAGLMSSAPVKGRFQAVDLGQAFAVLVDFAHTPAALDEALRAARELTARPNGRVIVVFGAGGDRDRGKRPVMGRKAGELADVVVITSDNPRSEKPLTIMEEVASGVRGCVPLVDADRRSAIFGAISMAAPGDVVLIAGKGHEQGQDFGTHVEPFDDAEVAVEALQATRALHPDRWRRR